MQHCIASYSGAFSQIATPLLHRMEENNSLKANEIEKCFYYHSVRIGQFQNFYRFIHGFGFCVCMFYISSFDLFARNTHKCCRKCELSVGGLIVFPLHVIPPQRHFIRYDDGFLIKCALFSLVHMSSSFYLPFVLFVVPFATLPRLITHWIWSNVDRRRQKKKHIV